MEGYATLLTLSPSRLKSLLQASRFAMTSRSYSVHDVHIRVQFYLMIFKAIRLHFTSMKFRYWSDKCVVVLLLPEVRCL
jgi:hypothetical protein